MTLQEQDDYIQKELMTSIERLANLWPKIHYRSITRSDMIIEIRAVCEALQTVIHRVAFERVDYLEKKEKPNDN